MHQQVAAAMATERAGLPRAREEPVGGKAEHLPSRREAEGVGVRINEGKEMPGPRGRRRRERIARKRNLVERWGDGVEGWGEGISRQPPILPTEITHPARHLNYNSEPHTITPLCPG